MGEYVNLPGVKTWYEVEGSGDPIVLLHGGLVSNELWEPQRAAFGADFQIFLPERRAHGRTPDVEGPLSLYDMADDTIDFLTTVVAKPAHLVGWSDGGNTALLVSIKRPDLVLKQVLVGANFLPATELEGGEELAEGLNPDNPGLAEFRASYEALSPDGADHWPVFLEKLAEMWRKEPNVTAEEFGRITAPTLVVTGDDDMMPLEHTIQMYRAISNSELAVVPGSSHALMMEKPQLANQIILDFLKNDPVPTMMPRRRAPADAQQH